MGEQQEFKVRYDHNIATALAKARELYQTRGDQYNITAHLSDYFPRGSKDYLWILRAKALRLQSLIEATDNPEGTKEERSGAKEKAKDEALDLINYASYLWAELVSERPKEEEEDEPIKGNDEKA